MRLGYKLLHVNALCLALGAGMSVQVAAQSTAPAPSKKVPTGAIAPQAPLTPQERLDAIRQSLVETTLQTPTRVSTTSWVDSQGSLRENSSFKNGLEVRGVKVLRFERDENGQAKATLQYPSNPDDPPTAPESIAPDTAQNSIQVAAQKLRSMVTQLWTPSQNAKSDATAAQNLTACKPQVGARMNHVIGLEVQIDPLAPHTLLQTLVPQIQAQWVQSNAQNGKTNAWRAVNNLTDASMANSMTAYERALVGNRPETLPWHAVLKVQTEFLQPTPVEAYLGAPHPYFLMKLAFQLVNTEGQPAQMEEEVTLQLELERASWSAPKLTASSVLSIQRQLQNWRNTAHDWLNCQPMNPMVTAVSGQQLEINVGALSGVRKGDEWLIANPAHFPGELVSREGAPQTLLAMVQSVLPHASKLMVVAGPAQAAQTNWRAWPTDTLVKEPSVLPTKPPASASKQPVKANARPNPHAGAGASASANASLTP
jgi:hypothetical protein